MSYDPSAVLRRYQQLLDLPEGEPEGESANLCALARPSGGVHHGSLGCEPGACDACCVGVVEFFREFAEQEAPLETRALALTDSWTKARKLTPE